MLNFSRQAHNAKVTDCHALFRILRFFELGCFLGRNIDLEGSFPIWAILGLPKQFLDLHNYFGILQKLLDFISTILEKKNIILQDHFKRKLLLNNHEFWHFSINPHIPRGMEKCQKSLSGCRSSMFAII